MKSWVQVKKEFIECVSECNPAMLNDDIAMRCSFGDHCDIEAQVGELTGLQYHYCPAFEDVWPLNTLEDDLYDILSAMGIIMHDIQKKDGYLMHCVLFRRSNAATFAVDMAWQQDDEPCAADVLREVVDNGGEKYLLASGVVTNEEWDDIVEMLEDI